MILGSVNGVVLADIYIIRVRADGQIGTVRDIGEGLVLGGRNSICLSVDLRLFECLLCPLSGDDIISHLIFHQVHGNRRKLKVRAALHEQYLVIVRDLHQIAQILLRLIDDLLEGLGAV